jgi:hypothetical protein
MLDLLRRMIRAAALDARLYEEIEADPRLVTQASVVVILAGLAAGTAAGWPDVGIILLATAFTLAGWFAWAAVTAVVGMRLLPEPSTRSSFGELLRTIGFAASPGLLHLLGLLPAARLPASAAALVWMLAATVVAVRQALDYRSTARAVVVCALGWIIQVAVAVVILMLFVATSRPAL